MKSGYSISWIDHALDELGQTIECLRLNFSQREIDNLAERIEAVLRFLSIYPNLYPETAQKVGVRRAVVARLNTLYYRVDTEADRLRILSFFSNRDDPEN
ncbi:MAG: hypothetical protein KBD94_05040 [Pyrinomonadaceae bacterium]|nr:hypothetical protein [Pyrinomonadaceae bacterium]